MSSIVMFGLAMRAARLLQLLLILQNRGRQTSKALAAELEVSPHTILRDVDAMTEAGLPIIVFQGNQGGIELGFDYRTRLTGLDPDEAEAMGLILTWRPAALIDLGLERAGARAAAKIWEAFPNPTRDLMVQGRTRFRAKALEKGNPDARRAALADAVRESRKVRLQIPGSMLRLVHPVGLHLAREGWAIECALCPGKPIPEAEWGRINISAQRFA